MHYVRLKGATVPVLGFGTQGLQGDACVRLVRSALEMGYRHLDTAAEYRNEAEVGVALRESGVDRGEVFLTTKVSRPDLGREAARRSCEESLARLGTDYVDLLLVHWPNPDVPLAETLDAFAALRAAGKARNIGVSNFTVPLLGEAIERHGAKLLTNQVEYHVLLSQRAMLDYLRSHGMMLTAYSPLARGLAPMSPGLARFSRSTGRVLDRIGGRHAKALLTAARDRLLKPRNHNAIGQATIPRHPTLARIGARHGKSAAQVALRWLIEQPGVAAIPRADHEWQSRENFAIFDLALSAEDRAEIATLDGGYRVVDPSYAPAWDPA